VKKARNPIGYGKRRSVVRRSESNQTNDSTSIGSMIHIRTAHEAAAAMRYEQDRRVGREAKQAEGVDGLVERCRATVIKQWRVLKADVLVSVVPPYVHVKAAELARMSLNVAQESTPPSKIFVF